MLPNNNNPSACLREYISRVNCVVDYIENHIDDNLTLDELANVANFSKYHFHRIFSSFVGETLFEFIQRLRLERAANMLSSDPMQSITEIAQTCGFSTSSSFAKRFKQHFGISASAWRNRAAVQNISNSNIRQVIRNHGKEIESAALYTEYIDQVQIWRVMDMNNKEQRVEVKELPEMTVAYVRSVGPYKGNAALFEQLHQKLTQWAAPRNLLHLPGTKRLNIYHDNPQITDESKLRISICLTVPNETPVAGEIGKMTLPRGLYALARFKLTPPEYEAAWNWFYGVWLPNSGYTCDDRPCFELYHDDCSGPQFEVDICIPVRPL